MKAFLKFLPLCCANVVLTTSFLVISQDAYAGRVCASEVSDFDRKSREAQEIVGESSSVFSSCRQGMFANSLSDFNEEITEKRTSVKTLTSEVRNANASGRCRALKRYKRVEADIARTLNKVRTNFRKYGGYFNSAIRKMSQRTSPRVCADYNGNMDRIERIKNYHLNRVIRSFLSLRECMSGISNQMRCN